MAEHRRVEPRGIAGTGMASDRERIESVEEEAERRGRAWRKAPEQGFGDVLKKAPPRGELADDDPDDPRRKKKPATDAQAEAALASSALAGDAPASSSNAPAAVDLPSSSSPAKADAKGVLAKVEKPLLPKVPKDPREALLRRKLEAAQGAPKTGFEIDTPPTGSRSRKPT